MAPHGKALTPIDHAVVDVLRTLMEAQNMGVRGMQRASGLGLNRTATIFREETPGVTVGELHAMAVALGTRGSLVLEVAETSVIRASVNAAGGRRLTSAQADALAAEVLATTPVAARADRHDGTGGPTPVRRAQHID